MSTPEISIVVPVYNEEANLEPLFARLVAVLDQVGRPWEILFTNDGSRDRSLELLRRFHQQRPKQVRVIDFNGNYGQHMAIIAAFERVRGEIIITLDADLQNPPEEIPKLLAKIDEGCDAVGGVRAQREDSFARKYLSRLINIVRERTTDIRMTDQGCMLARLPPPRGGRHRAQRRARDVHPRAGLQVRQPNGRGRGEARRAHGGRVEIHATTSSSA